MEHEQEKRHHRLAEVPHVVRLIPKPLTIVAIVALMGVVYFVVPFTGADVRTTWRLAATAVTLPLLGVFVMRQLSRGEDRIGHLLAALSFVVLVISAMSYQVQVAQPGQFEGMHTRLDALYFTVATMATVGYGDVHPVGQLARAIVTGTIVFDIVFVASLASAVMVRWRQREGLSH